MAENRMQRAAAAQAEPANGKKNLQQLVKAYEGEIRKALPSMITVERFTRMTLSALSKTPKLGDCTPMSFLGAMLTAAQLGLEPNTPLGQCHILPYWNGRKKCFEAQFQFGYKGLMDLAYRSGQVAGIQVKVVHANDEFECEFGLEPKLRHVPAVGDPGEPVSVYAIVKTTNGGAIFDVAGMDAIRAHAKKYSKSYADGPWQTAFESMAAKTILKQTLKYAPLAAETSIKIAADESIKSELAEDMFSVSNEFPYEDNGVETTGDAVPQTDENGEVIAE